MHDTHAARIGRAHRAALPGPDQPERRRRRGRRRAAVPARPGPASARWRRCACGRASRPSRARQLPPHIARGGGGQLSRRRQPTSARALRDVRQIVAGRRAGGRRGAALARAAAPATPPPPTSCCAPCAGPAQGLRLKVILETGELRDDALIARAARLALDCGADFLKTSTGKTPVGATPAAARSMLQAIAARSAGTRPCRAQGLGRHPPRRRCAALHRRCAAATLGAQQPRLQRGSRVFASAPAACSTTSRPCSAARPRRRPRAATDTQRCWRRKSSASSATAACSTGAQIDAFVDGPGRWLVERGPGRGDGDGDVPQRPVDATRPSR